MKKLARPSADTKRQEPERCPSVCPEGWDGAGERCVLDVGHAGLHRLTKEWQSFGARWIGLGLVAASAEEVAPALLASP